MVFPPKALLPALLVVALSARAEEPPPVSFRREIAPLLHRRCETCHGEESAKGRYRLDTFAALKKPGESDLPALVPGKPAESELYRLLTETDPHDRMPQKAEPLPATEIALVERWIKEGAKLDGGTEQTAIVEFARESLLRAAPEKYARPEPITALAFSPDAQQLAAPGYFELTVWDLGSGRLVRRVGGLPERIMSIAWNSKRNLIAIAGGSPGQWGTVALVDPAHDWKVQLLCDLPDTALSVAFNPDGTRLVAGAADRTVRLFDTASGKQTRILRQHADWVQSVAFDREGARVVSASRDRTIRVFDAASGELQTTVAGHESAVLSAIFSRDGKTIFATAVNNPIAIWDSESGARKTAPIDLPTRVERIAFVNAGLVATGSDGLLRVVQVGDRQTLFSLWGHTDAISAFATTGSGDTLVSGSYDGTVYVWSLACGTWISRFTASPGW